MKQTTVFVTYNPGNPLEQTIATRLHTIGAVSGFRVYLPDRYNSISILDEETKSRINQSDYVVMFSLGKLSSIVKQEIQTAFKHIGDKSKIIVVYDKHKGKNLTGEIAKHFTPFYFDKYSNKQDELLKAIASTITQKSKTDTIAKPRLTAVKKQKQANETNALAALLGVGIGLLVLGALSSSKK